ncbi:disulfide bond formation protein B [Methylocapsa sp. S129]|uniref:disulfide bond formation protein B n=1 Tax=Methylocapsa sp. S129 TaxID=1641869 RepID=UPI00131ADED8|nr:disulfide bond formation protein B [Methylocapsa sp. S129]
MLQVKTFNLDTRRGWAVLIAAAAAATLAGAWIFQGFGIVPCELCLKERIAYYGAVPLAALVAYAATGRARSIAVAGLIGLVLIFAVNAGLGIYHSGVEWALWKGPDDCTGAIAGAPKVADFLNELQHIKVVRCDEVQIRIFGLSLANWNVLISAALAAFATRAAILQD